MPHVFTGSPLRALQPWSEYRGYVHGMRLPSAAGRVAVVGASEAHARALDAALLPHILTATPPQFRADQPALGLVEHLAFWVQELLFAARIPVERTPYVRQIAPVDGQTCIYCALPAERLRAVKLALEWLFKQASGLFAPGGSPAISNDAISDLMAELATLAPPGVNRFFVPGAAHKLGLPYADYGELQRLGTGKYARTLISSMTDRTSALGLRIAGHKAAAATLMRNAGMPVPRQIMVESVAATLAAAEEIGGKVVVKPIDQEQGRGVHAGLSDRNEIAVAYKDALTHSRRIMVEAHVSGSTHRLTVLEGEILRVVRRIPGGVVGDGVSRVTELVDGVQEAARQRLGRFSPRLLRLTLDDEALALLRAEGLTPESVPAEGTFIRLRRRDNRNAGGTQERLDPADVHPDNLRLAVDAARLLGLDFAGIDLISTDIAVSWMQNGAAICEVNGMPQFGASTTPDDYLAVVRSLCPPPGRIPADLQICPAALIEAPETLERAAQGVDAAGSRMGIWRDGGVVSRPFATGFDAARALALNRALGSMRIVMTPEELAATGRPLEDLDVIEVIHPEALSDRERSLVRHLAALLAWPDLARVPGV